MILVINGSPKPHGNLHRMVEKIARDTGQDYEMVHLARLNIKPCIGCVKCAETNRCVQRDDMAPLYEKILAADVLVVGSVVYFGIANAITHTFLERMFPLRHIKMLTAGKLAAMVTVGSHEAEQVTKGVVHHLNHYFKYQVVGSVSFASATPPCFICGFGTTCQYGAPATWMKSEQFPSLKEITPEMFQNFEEYPAIVAACEQLSQELAQAIANLRC